MPRKVNIREVRHQELRSERTGEKYSLSAVLTEDLGLRDLFVHHEVIPPGRKASGAHFHTRREEMVVILQGEVVAWSNGAEVVLGAGDVVAFGPGEANAHFLRNDASEEARVLVIASNPGEDDVGYVEMREEAKIS